MVKDFLGPLAEHMSALGSTDLPQLHVLAKYAEANAKMLLQGQPRLKKFQEQIERRIEGLEKDDHGEEALHLIDGTLTVEEREVWLAATLEKLQSFYDDEILGTLVDLVQDNDEDISKELQSVQLAGLKIASDLKKKEDSP